MKRAKRGDYPPTSDGFWDVATLPVVHFLQEARTWKDLDTFRRKNRYQKELFVNMMAWLSIHEYAKWQNKKWIATVSLHDLANSDLTGW